MNDDRLLGHENGFESVINDNQIFTIKQLIEGATQITGFRYTHAMIYNYERLNLLPKSRRSPGGTRLFQLEDVARIVRIKRLQKKGFSLKEIKEKLDREGNQFEEEIDLSSLVLDSNARILDAAAIIFPQKGYVNTTIQDIAQKANVSTTTIYQHFKSKNDLFLALINRFSFIEVYEDIASVINEDKILEEKDLRSTLIEIAEAFLSTHHANAEVMRLFYTETKHNHEIGELYCKQLMLPTINRTEAIFIDQIKKGNFRNIDAKYAVHAFFGIFLTFFMLEDILFGSKVLDLEIEGRIPELVDLFLKGVLAKDV